MKKLSLILLSAIVILTGCSQRSPLELTSAEKINDHIVWKTIQTAELEINKLPATINILDVDMKKFDGDIDLAWYPEDLIITSKIAEGRGKRLVFRHESRWRLGILTSGRQTGRRQ